MRSQQQENIKLQEFLTAGTMPQGWAWKCLGIHVESELEAENVEIPENAIDCRTVEKSFNNGQIEVGAEWNKRGYLWQEDGRAQNMQIVGIVNSPEELHDKFPQLFELEGDMYPFA